MNGLCFKMKICFTIMVGTNAEKIIFVFGTDNELQLLANADTWFLDANLKLAPKPFLQLYVTRIEKDSVFILS